MNIESTTLVEDLFNIFGFIDGSVTESYTKGTGPNGKYRGTMRHNHAEIQQLAVYSGYKIYMASTHLGLCCHVGFTTFMAHVW